MKNLYCRPPASDLLSSADVFILPNIELQWDLNLSCVSITPFFKKVEDTCGYFPNLTEKWQKASRYTGHIHSYTCIELDV